MKTWTRLTAAAATALVASALVASAVWSQTVTVEEPWVRGTVAQQKATGAFMRLKADQPVRLVAAASPVAGVVEIHEMAMDNNVMKMRQIPGLDLPAGKTVELKPGGYHVMLMDLKQPVSAGQTVPLTLVFETADKRRIEQQVQASVRALGASSSMPPSSQSGHHGHDHGHRH